MLGKLLYLQNHFFKFLQSKITHIIISIPITFTFIFYYFSEMNKYNINEILLNTDFFTFFFTFFFASLVSFLRAIRLKKIAILSGSKNTPLFSIFNVNNLSIAINTIVPMRLGDAVGIILLKKVIKIKNSFLIIFIDRISDLLFAFLIFLLCSFTISFKYFSEFNFINSFILFFLLILSLIFFTIRKSIFNYFKNFLNSKVINWVFDFFVTLTELFSNIKSIQILIFSFLIWTSFSLQIWIGTIFFLPNLNFLQILLIVSSVSLGQIIQLTPSNLGIYHSIFISLCVFFNEEFQGAIAAAIFTHLGMVLTSLFYGLIGLIFKYKT